MNSKRASENPPGNIPDVLVELVDQVDQLTQLVQEIHQRESTKPEIEPKARYRLDRAANYLGVSASTLKRRARAKKFVILYDGKTPFVMGAEILRYSREGATRKRRARRSSRRSR